MRQAPRDRDKRCSLGLAGRDTGNEGAMRDPFGRDIGYTEYVAKQQAAQASFEAHRAHEEWVSRHMGSVVVSAPFTINSGGDVMSVLNASSRVQPTPEPKSPSAWSQFLVLIGRDAQ